MIGPAGPSRFTVRSSPTRDRPTPTCSPRPPTGHPTAPCSWPTTRRRGAAALDRTWDAPAWQQPARVDPASATIPTSRTSSRNASALAAVRACERVAEVSPELKWPNDLLLDGAQAGRRPRPGRRASGVGDHVVVGIGLNVGWAPEGAARLGDGTRRRGALARCSTSSTASPTTSTPSIARRLATLGQRTSASSCQVERARRAGGRRRARTAASSSLDECGHHAPDRRR